MLRSRRACRARSHGRFGWALLLACCVLQPACAGRETVVRVVGGREVAGRYVPPEAYSAYAAGALAEARAQWTEAAHAYELAAQYDRKGAEPLTRLGAVRCAASPNDFEAAQESFGAALHRVPGYAPAHLEQGRCAMRRGALELAERDLRRAMRLDPDDIETSLALATVLEARGQPAAAARMLDGLTHWRGTVVRVWREVLALAQRRGDEVRARLARDRLVALHARTGIPIEPSLQGSGRGAIDEALLRGSLEDARQASVRAGIAAAMVAVRAAALAQWDLALEQAAFVLRANPGEPDAIAALFAALSAGATGASGEARLPRASALRAQGRPTPIGALVMAEALQRRFGGELAAAFLDSYGRVEVDREDSVAVALLTRLALPRHGQHVP